MTRTRVRPARLALLLAVSLGAVAAVGSKAAGNGGRPTTDVPVTRHVVQPGDTLWEIARATVGAEEDPRPMIEAIRMASGLGPEALIPGTVILVPASP